MRRTRKEKEGEKGKGEEEGRRNTEGEEEEDRGERARGRRAAPRWNIKGPWVTRLHIDLTWTSVVAQKSCG